MNVKNGKFGRHTWRYWQGRRCSSLPVTAKLGQEDCLFFLVDREGSFKDPNMCAARAIRETLGPPQGA